MGKVVTPTPDLNFLTTANAIAESTREWALEIARKERTPSNLHGLCARASAMVFKGLTLQGYAASIAYSSADKGHVFIINDPTNYLIDVTASQFNSKHTIEIRPWNRKLPWYWSKIMHEMSTLNELAEWTHDWGREQQVRLEEYEIFPFGH